MKKTIQKIAIALFTLVNIFAYGQNNLEDVVYLKNNSIIKGQIIEQEFNQFIKIQTNDGQVLVFKNDEIEKSKKEEISDNHKLNKSETNNKKHGFFLSTELNYSADADSENEGNKLKYDYSNITNSFGFKCVSGYQFNNYLSMGIGIGVDKYKHYTSMPITFDVNVLFLKGKVTPFINANTGYATRFNNINGSMVSGLQIGIKKNISNNIAFIFKVGLKWEEVSVRYTWTITEHYYSNYVGNIPIDKVYEYSELSKLKFITFSTGFVF